MEPFYDAQVSLAGSEFDSSLSILSFWPMLGSAEISSEDWFWPRTMVLVELTQDGPEGDRV
jgi:hypothetical protein